VSLFSMVCVVVFFVDQHGLSIKAHLAFDRILDLMQITEGELIEKLAFDPEADFIQEWLESDGKNRTRPTASRGWGSASTSRPRCSALRSNLRCQRGCWCGSSRIWTTISSRSSWLRSCERASVSLEWSGVPVMLIRNLNTKTGLCNGARFTVALRVVRGPKVCWVCGEPGHFKANCPKRQPPQSTGDRNGSPNKQR
jgi:hypothetical protein